MYSLGPEEPTPFTPDTETERVRVRAHRCLDAGVHAGVHAERVCVCVHALWGPGGGCRRGPRNRGAFSPRGSLALGGSRFRRFRDGFTHGLSFRHFFLALRRPLEPLWGGGRALKSPAPSP